MKTLYIVRGVSGAGKSTLAQTLSSDGYWPVCEADQYHYTEDGVYDWKPENMNKAHKWCQDMVRDAMEINLEKIIVSNTSTSEKELQPYLVMATLYGYQVVSIVLENRHGNDSVHNVPQEIRDAQESRLRNSLKLQ
ncbi:3'-phosphatase, 5'-polynucleotide kinase [Klebsiella phage KP12]|uniref:3'-phosphatase, 5'-polynucleotide kinase n=1 Tax=Klebsiella phage KP12 TaxID=2923374 RepID=A0A9E7CJ13_9CAUD|nr:3'-phosphatase, 5'-polynucleotide kinase [Klebsiella phage KP12]